LKNLTKEILTVIKKRPANSHKGNYGRVVTVGGTQQYGGAILMSTSAAVHAGAGLVTCATAPENLTALHSLIPEAMFVDFTDEKTVNSVLLGANAIVVGPGLGTDKTSLSIVKNVFANVKPEQYLIIDGSAITLLSQENSLQEALPNAHIIFTPHEMEWQRLSGIKIAEQTEENNRQIQEKLECNSCFKKASYRNLCTWCRNCPSANWRALHVHRRHGRHSDRNHCWIYGPICQPGSAKSIGCCPLHS
jgi:Predicted sugar kinase